MEAWRGDPPPVPEEVGGRRWPWLLLALPVALVVLAPIAVLPRLLASRRPQCPAPPLPPEPNPEDLLVLSPQWVATAMAARHPPPAPAGFLFTGSAPLDATDAAIYEAAIYEAAGDKALGDVERALQDAAFVSGYQFSWRNGDTAANFVVLQFATVIDARAFEARRWAALCPRALRISPVPGIAAATKIVVRDADLYLHRTGFQRGTRQHYFYVYDPAREPTSPTVADLIAIASPTLMVQPPPPAPTPAPGAARLPG